MSDPKCACPDCTCAGAGPNAVKRDGKAYCSEACAKGHPDGKGCCDGTCPCAG